jgi:hypothetical protein
MNHANSGLREKRHASAAQYLTFVAATGDSAASVEMRDCTDKLLKKLESGRVAPVLSPKASHRKGGEK